MLKHFTKHLRKTWLIALLAFTVFGVQVLQASPIHDHVHETVDCALCHLQTLGDDSELARSLPLVAQQRHALPSIVFVTFYSLLSPAPYQGRAPPFPIC